MDDFRRIADAAVSIADELAALRAGFEPMSSDLDALRAAFAATTDELQQLRGAFAPELAGVNLAADGLHEEVRRQRELIDKLESTLEEVGQLLDRGIAGLIATLKPVVRDLDEVREVMEPLQTATERVGRVAERFPGPGRKR